MNFLWVLVFLNFLISAWDSYAAGMLWGMSKNWANRVISISAMILGFAGMLYSFVIVGIIFNLIPETYLIATNVLLGFPIIVAGIVITINGWIQSLRRRSILGFLINIWNTFAIIWDIRIWFNSLGELKEMGGMTSLLKGDNDSKGKAILFLIVAIILTCMISIGLFITGKKKMENL